MEGATIKQPNMGVHYMSVHNVCVLHECTLLGSVGVNGIPAGNNFMIIICLW